MSWNQGLIFEILGAVLVECKKNKRFELIKSTFNAQLEKWFNEAEQSSDGNELVLLETLQKGIPALMAKLDAAFKKVLNGMRADRDKSTAEPISIGGKQTSRSRTPKKESMKIFHIIKIFIGNRISSVSRKISNRVRSC